MSLIIRKIRRRRLWFPAALAIIAVVSLYDTYLIIAHGEGLRMMEQNPFGRWLLEVNNYDVGVFVRSKLAGTLIVLSILIAMYRARSRFVFPVSTSVASGQVMLFVYLTVG